MGKVAVVYWSGTGNTQAMAEAVAQASGGALFTAAEFGPEKLAEYEAIAFWLPLYGYGKNWRTANFCRCLRP